MSNLLTIFNDLTVFIVIYLVSTLFMIGILVSKLTNLQKSVNKIIRQNSLLIEVTEKLINSTEYSKKDQNDKINNETLNDHTYDQF